MDRTYIIASLFLGVCCFAQDGSAQENLVAAGDGGAKAPSLVPEPDFIMPHMMPTKLAGLTNAEVIERLPEVGFEQTRNIKTDWWDEDEAVNEMMQRVEKGLISSEEMGKAFAKAAVLRSSAQWFKGEPFRVWFRLPQWLAKESWFDATAKLVQVNGKPIDAEQMLKARSIFPGCGNGLQLQEHQEAYQLVQRLPDDATSATFEVRVLNTDAAADLKSEWKFTVTLPVTLVDRADPTPVDDPPLTAAVKQLVNVSCANGHFREGPAGWLSSWFRRPATGPLTNTIVRTELAILEGEKQVYVQIAEDPDGEYPDDIYFKEHAFLRGDLAAQIIDRKDLERFTVRVRGMPPGKEGNQWCRAHYWAGEYTVPLTELLEPECGMRPAGLLDEKK